MLFSEFQKKEVLDVNANKVGEIVDVELDFQRGAVLYYVLKTRIFKKIYITPDTIDKVGEKVFLKTGKEDLDKSYAEAR
jgi:sporulation protein YlmC with PRC-barrel domain